MIEIDGSHGEGGGQILRTSLSLAALTGQAIHITRIRAGRSKPGLAPQHLAGVLAAAKICQAQVEGARLRSTELTFRPQAPPQPGTYVFDVAEAIQGGSAGSITLLLQTVLLPLALVPGRSHLILRGGTHVPWSPSYEYVAHVYLPTLAGMGVRAISRLDRWGFYPRGGGQVTVDIIGLAQGREALEPLELTERGSLQRVWGEAVACSLPSHIAQRMANRSRNVLAGVGLSGEITPRRVSGVGPGAYTFLAGEYGRSVAGFTALGERGKPSERVADEACQAFLAFHRQDAPVDRHLGDQLLLPAALAPGASRYRVERITRHLLTNAYVIRRFLPVTVTVHGEEGQPGTVVCQPNEDQSPGQ